MNYKMTIIVPIYNEEDNINRLTQMLRDYLSQSSTKSKVLFIDDGSKDNGLALLKNACDANEDFKFLSLKQNYGLSAAIKAGIDYCDTELIGYIDADLQTTPFEFDLLLEHIDKYTLVMGYRGVRKDTMSKKIQSKIANFVRRLLINDGIKDTGCPLKVIRTDAAKKIPFFDGMHRFIPALILLQKGTIKQIKVKHFPRIAGQSKFNVFNRSIKPLQDTFAYRWMKKRYINYEVQEKQILN
jgi:dolichol-phosphate mannosyltransferase